MRSRGFTLIEVLVAMAIFALAAIAVINATTSNIHSLSILEQKTLADWVAANKLNDAQYQDLKDGAQGTETQAGVEWYWRIKKLKTEDKDFSALEVTVSRSSDFSHPEAVLRSYFEVQS
ncbi:type II secretion system minor pseudopilin GspI [Gallaecimonas kandeliae]|uniref:type II secretion system minor pseudopilin GspI n=1 Tax=Gallaecimonas kandeliae TaxID=3029055 RepID=UPI002649A00A|nr:type II secretion system minor pseudopilin GspI [Gallaecimonas kandeliae]WKE65919.1 type II secretion system minor pseudopilin GspI [Gallaecimonas kandeliae]